jgi:hypothetical protein
MAALRRARSTKTPRSDFLASWCSVERMRNFRAPFVVVVAIGLAAALAHAAAPSLKLSTLNTVDGGSLASNCTAPSALGLSKKVLVSCDSKVHIRRACATNSASCMLDAGVGDPTYNFYTSTLAAGASVLSDGGTVACLFVNGISGPVEIDLRSTESRLCMAADDAGTATCWLNSTDPF